MRSLCTKMRSWSGISKRLRFERGEMLPSVDECFVEALDSLSVGTMECLINASIYLATASRGLEREAFKSMCLAIDAGSSTSGSVEFISENMEAVFDHILEAIGNLSLSLGESSQKKKTEQVNIARLQATLAHRGWVQIQQLSIYKQPGGIQ